MTFVYIVYLFYLDMIGLSPPAPQHEEHPRLAAGCEVEFEDEVDKPMDRKELKRLEKQAKERMKRDKAVLKELQKQMRKGVD